MKLTNAQLDYLFNQIDYKDLLQRSIDSNNSLIVESALEIDSFEVDLECLVHLTDESNRLDLFKIEVNLNGFDGGSFEPVSYCEDYFNSLLNNLSSDIINHLK